MSNALAKFKLQQTRKGQSDAGIGATFAYNGMMKEVLPSIENVLKVKILERNKKIHHISDLKTRVYKCECWEGCQDVKTYDDTNT